MPKQSLNKLRINFDLLRPQSNPVKLPVKIIRWLLSSGRYIFIFVEGLVLIAFVARFKLDADLTNLNDSIEEQIPYIESLKAYEVRIRQTQLKLTTIDNINQNSADYGQVLKKIAAQTPSGVKINNLTFDKSAGKVNIQINGQATSNINISTLVSGIKSDNYFSDVNLASVGVEEGVIKFSISAGGSIFVNGGSI